METQTKGKADGAEKSHIGRDQIGSVKIADDVVAMIAALAALEVDGVSSLAQDVKSDAVGRLSGARLSRCVKVAVDQGKVRAEVSVVLKYGYHIPTTSGQVQARVKNAIENMTGLAVTTVNVRIAEITMPAVSARD